MPGLKSKFLEVYSQLKSEILNDQAFEHDQHSRKWVEQLQAHILVMDDILDNSLTRSGQPFWFRQPKVGMIPINDCLLLRNHIPRILKWHFKGKPYYVDLLDLFTETDYYHVSVEGGFQTTSGKMIDLISSPEGENDLSNYSLPLHHSIVQYKTAYYSFYLPVSSALLLAGQNLEIYPDVKTTLIHMGIYVQLQDDYLDYLGDPGVIGQVGTDIEDCECSWLVVKALELADEEKKKILYENYGKTNKECIEKVRELYNISTFRVFMQNLRGADMLVKSVEAHPNAVQAVLKSVLAKINKRIE